MYICENASALTVTEPEPDVGEQSVPLNKLKASQLPYVLHVRMPCLIHVVLIGAAAGLRAPIALTRGMDLKV